MGDRLARVWFQHVAISAILLALSLVCGPAAQADPSGVRVSAGLIAEPVSEIGADELWHLSTPQHVFSKHGAAPGGVIGVWTYDRESGLRDGGWVAVCLIMDGFGDVAERPVAIRIWAQTYAAARITERPPGANRSVAFEIGVGTETVLLSHTPEGQVFLGDHAIGQIR